MKKNILFVSFLLFTLILSACGASTPEPAQQDAAAAVSSTALFQIIKADGTKFDVTLDAVKALPLATVIAEGKVEEGPYLSDILALAGVTEFTEVTLSGSSSPDTLTLEQVDENKIGRAHV